MDALARAFNDEVMSKYRGARNRGARHAVNEEAIAHLGWVGTGGRVPTGSHRIQKGGDVRAPVAMIDFGGCPDMCSEKLWRHDQIGAVRLDMGMERFLQTNRAVSGLGRDRAQDGTFCD